MLASPAVSSGFGVGVSAVDAVRAVKAVRAMSAEYPSRSKPGYKTSLGSGSHRDTVELSGAAIAKSLELDGLSPVDIAARMGFDVKTIEGYLGK